MAFNLSSELDHPALPQAPLFDITISSPAPILYGKAYSETLGVVREALQANALAAIPLPLVEQRLGLLALPAGIGAHR